MKIAIVGSRGVIVNNLERYIPDGSEIVSGGARGVDSCAAAYAKRNGLKLVEFLPDYDKYGRGAPLVRNRQIVDYADKVIVFWDGGSRGSHYVIEYAKKVGKPCEVILCEQA